jgi:Predicted transcriptional regulators
MARPVQEFFSIGEVCALTDLKPHVLRYWESQFRFLNPAKNRSGNRVYKSREVELIMLVKHLLYTEKYTIEGARQRIEHYRRTGELRNVARRPWSERPYRSFGWHSVRSPTCWTARHPHPGRSRTRIPGEYPGVE